MLVVLCFGLDWIDSFVIVLIFNYSRYLPTEMSLIYIFYYER